MHSLAMYMHPRTLLEAQHKHPAHKVVAELAGYIAQRQTRFVMG